MDLREIIDILEDFETYFEGEELLTKLFEKEYQRGLDEGYQDAIDDSQYEDYEPLDISPDMERY